MLCFCLFLASLQERICHFYTSYLRKFNSGFSQGRLHVFIQLCTVVLCWLFLGNFSSTSETYLILYDQKNIARCWAALDAAGPHTSQIVSSLARWLVQGDRYMGTSPIGELEGLGSRAASWNSTQDSTSQSFGVVAAIPKTVWDATVSWVSRVCTYREI